MTGRPTDAEQIDRAVSAVLEDRAAVLSPPLAGELALARALRAGLGVVPPSTRFEDALAERLRRAGAPGGTRRLAAFARSHQRLVLTGAVGSVLLSTASVVAWRVVHR